MFAPRHEYLSLGKEVVKPAVLNRALDKALQIISRPQDLNPPLLPLQSTIPNIYGPHVDLLKSKLAFGRWALPKLRKELHDTNPLVVRQAVNTMNDIVHDPEKAFEAIRLGVVKRLVGLLLDPDAFIRERCAMILTTLGGQAMGRDAITHSPKTLKNLHDLVQDEVLAVRFKACLALEMIARAWMSADCLNDYGFVGLLLHRLVLEEDQAIIIAQLEILQHLFDRDVKLEAINKGGMPVMKKMLNHYNPEIIAGACACIALLSIHPEGKKMINILQLMTILRELLFHQNLEVRTKAAGAIMFATLTTSNKLQALQLDMLDRLLLLAKDFHCHEIQINCIKALTNIAEAPEGRVILLNHVGDIQAIRPSPRTSKSLERHIDTLLTVVLWKP